MSNAATKKCTKCGVVKSVQEFSGFLSKEWSSKYVKSYCTLCNALRIRNWLNNNPEKRRELEIRQRAVDKDSVRVSGRKAHSKRRYGEFWQVHRKFLEIKRILKTKGEVK